MLFLRILRSIAMLPPKERLDGLSGEYLETDAVGQFATRATLKPGICYFSVSAEMHSDAENDLWRWETE